MAGKIKAIIAAQFEDSGLKKAQKGFAGLSKSIKAAIGAVGFGALTSGLKIAGKAAAEDAKSQGLLALALRNTVGATNEQIAAVEIQITKFQNLSSVADDEIRPAFAQSTRATGDVAAATGLMQVALDVAAGTGRDVNAVAIALGRAYNGNTTALSRLGVNVKGVNDPLGVLAKQFEGAAEAAARLDPFKRLERIFDDLQEQIGMALLPYLNQFADWLASPLGQEQLQTIARVFAEIVQSVFSMITWLSNNSWIVKTIAALGALVKAWIVIFNVTKAVYGAQKAIALTQFVTKGAQSAPGWGAIAAAAAALAAGIGTFVAIDALIGNISGNVENIKEEAGKIPAVPVMPDTTKPGAKGTKAANDAAAKAAEASRKAADQLAEAYIKAAEAAEEFMVSTRKMVAGFTDLFKVTPALGAFEQATVDAFTNIFDTIDSALSDGLILSGAANALRDYATSERKTLQAIARQRDVLAGKIDVARTITAGVMGLVNITGFLETTSRSVTETVGTIINGISVATTKTFDVVESGGLIDNFQKLVDKTKAFAKNLVALKKLGLNSQLFAQLVNAGADAGGATAEAIVAGGADTISALNGLYNELALSASDIAANATDTLYEVGQQVVSNGFIEGLLSQDSELQRAAQTLADAFASTFTTQLQLAVDAVLPSGSSMIDQVASVNLSGGGVGGRGTAFNAASTGRATVFNVNVSAGVVTDPNGLARTVIDSVKKYERANGSVWVAA
jgi:hypothetical protein